MLPRLTQSDHRSAVRPQERCKERLSDTAVPSGQLGSGRFAQRRGPPPRSSRCSTGHVLQGQCRVSP